MKVDTVAKYIRLSDEDIDTGSCGKTESGSIVSQRQLLDDFINRNRELGRCRVIEFCDDGFSGTNFKRPGFERMMEAVKRGEIGCIIVKDFSRLGRDYIEVGSYLEQIFPLMEVRCISVNDNYDSEGVLGTTGGLNIAFKNLINMLYSRDLSQKIRSARMVRARKGEYLGGFARYGYEKSPEDKHQLVVDPEAAEVVRTIFRMAAEGITVSQIARYLNDNHVLTCVEYKKSKNSRYQHPGTGVKKLWGTASVRSILSDETYIGKVVYNRGEKSITTGKKMIWHDRSEWVVADGQHEPLVSKELFELANEKAKPKKRDRSNVDMSGFKREVLFVCGYCGRSMVKKNHRYSCRYRTCATDTECKMAVEMQDVLEETVMEYVRSTANVMLDKKEKAEGVSEKEILLEKIEYFQKEKKRLTTLKLLMYDKYKSGQMTREQFKAESSSIAEQIDEIKVLLAESEEKVGNIKGTGFGEEDSLNEIAALQGFDKAVLRKAIDRIKVFGDGRIEVIWKADDTFW